MKTLQQRYIRPDGTDFYITHLYSQGGHFERDGKPAGIHIELGTNDNAMNYREVLDGTIHDVPESLPDVILPEEEDDDAEIEDYQAALTEMGVTIHEEE